MHSRDELRSRGDEIEPRWHDLGGDQPPALRACWPTDPDGGGTWVGVSESGLFLGLLNLNLADDEIHPDTPEATKSRGMVILSLIGEDSVSSAVAKITQMNLLGMRPFRMTFAGHDARGTALYAAARFDGVQLTITTDTSPLIRPVCWASSGLGDRLVQCRLPLFEQMVGADPSHESQRNFHWHQWEDRTELSVMMSRPDARTSSVTTIEVYPGIEPKIVYDPIAVGDPKADPVGAGMLR